MVEQLAWTDRSRFPSDLPVGLFPSILARLRGTPARLDELVRRLPADALARRHGGAWSIQEHVGHLLDLEELWAWRIRDYLTGAAELTPADMSNRKTWEAEHNARSVTELLEAFRWRRELLVARLEDQPADVVDRSALHPRLRQPMRLIDFCYFAAEHDDHHLARIFDLAAKPPLRAAGPPSPLPTRW